MTITRGRHVTESPNGRVVGTPVEEQIPIESPSSPAPAVPLSEVESLAQELIDLFGDDLTLDTSAVDLSMPDDYAALLWAGRRVLLVRDAALTKTAMMAAKAGNPGQVDALMKQFNVLTWELAIIDKRWPDAVALSHYQMKREGETARKQREAAG